MASRFAVVLKKDALDGGYVATVPELPGCISDGDTKAEALVNVKDAIKLYLGSIEVEMARLRVQARKNRNVEMASVVVST